MKFENQHEWIGCALDQNTRDKMEDVVDVELFEDGGIFMVLDGHNGILAVNFVAKFLSKNILKFMETTDIEQSLQMGFSQTEADLLKYLLEHSDNKKQEPDLFDLPILTSGVVVCVVVLKSNKVFTAHVGDCRAVLSRNFDAIELTRDHNMSDPGERQRIESIGTKVSLEEGYVNGLMVTRSLGNVCMQTLKKCEGQIAVPTISNFQINTETDEFILIASDGLFEVFSNECVVGEIRRAMMRPSFSPKNICEELVQRAISRGSCDNICACIVLLGKLG